MKYVYCSGPIFCPEEVAGLTAIANVLEEAGYGTFLPTRDGLERFVLGLIDSPLNTNLLGIRERTHRAIFALDVFQIVERCDFYVMNMNGRVPDEGAVAEAAIAFSTGKPVVFYKNDRRAPFLGDDNSMLLGLSMLAPVDDMKKLPAAIRKAGKRMNKIAASARPPLPGNLEQVVRQGEKVWRALSSKAASKLGKKETGELVKEIVEALRQ